MSTEAWLEGPLLGVDPCLMPVAHGLVQVSRDLGRVTDLTTDQLWARLGGAASVGFHLRHVAGVLGRLPTYARGEALSPEQLRELQAEGQPGNPPADVATLVRQARAAVESALGQVCATPREALLELQRCSWAIVAWDLRALAARSPAADPASATGCSMGPPRRPGGNPMRPGRLAILPLVTLAVACSGDRDVTGKWVVDKALAPRAGAPAAPSQGAPSGGGPGGPPAGAPAAPSDGGPMRDAVLDLKQQGTSLTGTITTHMGDMPISKGTVKGDDLSFAIKIDEPGASMEIPFTGKKVAAGIELTVNPPAGMPPMSFLLKRATDEEVARRVGTKPEKIAPPPIQPLADNGLARTPPMGWNSWNCFHLDVSDAKIREIADAMVKTGMRDAGYQYVVIDDGWQGQRDANGVLHPTDRFPDMKALGDYVHGMGLKLGIYSSPGPRTCGNREGSYGHEEQDARMFAQWGVDYIKYDWCGARRIYANEEMQPVYQKMGEILGKTGRPIVYGLCQYGLADVWRWGPDAGGNLWRTTGDIGDTWQSMETIGFGQGDLAQWARPGHWNDPDMLEVGNGGMTGTEYRTHISLWSLLAAPLLAGNDLRAMSKETLELLTNPEVIAIDQDALGKQARRISQDGKLEVWARPLADGRVAAGLFNRGNERARVAARWTDLGLKGKARVRDAWARKDLGSFADAFAADVEPHGVVLVVVRG